MHVLELMVSCLRKLLVKLASYLVSNFNWVEPANEVMDKLDYYIAVVC